VIADPAPVRVAVGFLTDAAGRVLVARRASGKPWAGYWEFPGGKQEAGESRLQALRRELREELGIEVSGATPLIRLPPEPDAALPVVLDVWRVTAYGGTPAGCEGQTVAWVTPDELDRLPMPPANRIIRRAGRLPDRYLVTPPDPMPLTRLIENLRCAIRAGIRLIQVRRPDATKAELAAVAAALRPDRAAGDVLLLLNGAPGDAHALGYDGVHLNGARLASLAARPDRLAWIGASCHDATDLARARALALDFAVLSPVRATPGHARVAPLGWRRWARQVRAAGLPVYALGGMAGADRDRARRLGGQGIAAIRGLWPACA
jgi:8-oxo-dGTP diphosphatase